LGGQSQPFRLVWAMGSSLKLESFSHTHLPHTHAYTHAHTHTHTRSRSYAQPHSLIISLSLFPKGTLRKHTRDQDSRVRAVRKVLWVGEFVQAASGSVWCATAVWLREGIHFEGRSVQAHQKEWARCGCVRATDSGTHTTLVSNHHFIINIDRHCRAFT
jgi:hypothetical protein